MKKLLLLLLLIINLNCNNSATPKTKPLSFNTVFKHIVNDALHERTLIETAIIGTAAYWLYTGQLVWTMLDYVVTNNNIPMEQIKPTIAQWHKEKPKIFTYTFDLIELLDPKVVYGLGGDYPEMVAKTKEMFKKAKKVLPKATCLDALLVYNIINSSSIDQADRYSKAIECLHKLGAKQNYNDYQLNLLAQIPSHGNYGYEYYEKVYKALESLIETYNK